jgi:hypothetical protein
MDRSRSDTLKLKWLNVSMSHHLTGSIAHAIPPAQGIFPPGAEETIGLYEKHAQLSLFFCQFPV